MVQRLRVKAEDDGRRVDVVLAQRLSGSRSQWQKRLEAGDVTLDRQPLAANFLVRSGQSLSIAEPVQEPVPESKLELPIVYEDSDIMVVDKPAGVPTHGGAGVTGPTVADFSRDKVNDEDSERPGIVHRLDKDTSGLLLIAKTPAAKVYLHGLFKARGVHKTYFALVKGQLKPPAAVIRLPIARSTAQPLKRAVQPGGKLAETAYETTEVFAGVSLVKARPVTGRTHQLRVHFAALGHPIIGDTTYGERKRPAGLARQFLHAAELEFVAPSGRHLELESPLPPDLQRFLDGLRV